MNATAVTFEERRKALSQKFYLTTAIAYLNGHPHLGHAYEFLSSGIVNRFFGKMMIIQI